MSLQAKLNAFKPDFKAGKPCAARRIMRREDCRPTSASVPA